MTFADERPVAGALASRVRAEWPLDGADVEADVRAWREGAELYEEADDDELLCAGELMARAVRHTVHGRHVLRDDDLAVTVQSLLFSASTPNAVADPDDARRLARLALAVILEHGWHPPHLGGNGPLPVEIFEDADIQGLLDAVAGDVDGLAPPQT